MRLSESCGQTKFVLSFGNLFPSLCLHILRPSLGRHGEATTGGRGGSTDVHADGPAEGCSEQMEQVGVVELEELF